jgi:hypothetical protein
MKALLMHPSQDFDAEQDLPPNCEALSQDLDLDELLEAMAAGDEALFEVARRALFATLTDPGVILYRQRVLADCLRHPLVVREMHEVAIAAIEGRRTLRLSFLGYSPDSILSSSVRLLALFLPLLRKLRKIADEARQGFQSQGFERMFGTLVEELGDDYLLMLEAHLRRLQSRHGVLLSARLGKGNTGTNYTVRLPRDRGWKELLTPWNRAKYSFPIPRRDDPAVRELSQIRGRGVNLVANALAQSTDHILSFFRTLRIELGFYVACLNLQERLSEKGEPTCFPTPAAVRECDFSATGLYDVCLALRTKKPLVGNDIDGRDKRLAMITGANGGGKSTFLRSVGSAQLMMQCGMFVPARSLRANVSGGIFTHFKREEDASMEKGKLDEELGRMNEIADTIAPGCLLLCNESFSSTNEREGSEIARQIVRALTDSGVKVFYVTHMYDLAHGLHARSTRDALFLRAERRSDGSRTFKLHEAEPLSTGFGEDLFREIFGPAEDTETTPPVDLSD